MRFPFRFPLAIATIHLLLAGAAHAVEVMTVEPRPGVTLRLLVEAPAGAKAVALLIPGGHGKVLIKADGTFKGLKGNFLVRSRDRFVANRIATAVFDAPSDHRDKAGLTFEYRMTPEHAADIGKVVSRLHDRFPDLPIWLVGTSRGSTSAANAAAVPGSSAAAGVVLTSSVGVPFKKGGNVLDFDLKGIKIPALVVHHKNDGCVATPVEGARAIRAALTSARRADLLVFEGGDEVSDPCQGKSHHGYLGIEDKVVDAISAWILGR